MRSVASFIALNRFGMGAGPGDDARVGDDPRGWLHAQIRRDRPLPERLSGFRSSDAILTGIYAARLDGVPAQRQAINAAYEQDFRPEVLARAAQMVLTPEPLVERMVQFWSNHFTVSTSRRVSGPAIPAFEREVIRPQVFGRFADMLKAASRHPSMLIYLDNPASIGPGSPAGIRRRENQGTATTLNENLAREILELHTLGVGGGYDQQDVIGLALALTGWSHGGLRRGGDENIHGGFVFVRRQHEPGPKVVLGQSYAEAGADEGLRILDDLARHPSTARHLATKLVRHFVADDPPEAEVAQIARVYLDSDGDLGQVTAALIDLEAVWRDPLAKIKSHEDFVIAVHRAAGQGAPRPRELFPPLRVLAQMPFSARSPQGWGDRAGDWIAPESLMIRLEWAHQFAARLPGGLVPRQVMEDSVGAVARDVTQTWIDRAPSPDTALTMLFGSPEFQRR